jgi:esterase/lipase
MKKDLLINSSGIVLNLLEKILNANIDIKGIENIPKDHPRMFVANHFTRMEAMIVPYAMYNLTGKKVGVIADDGLFKTYFGNFLKELGAMRKSNPCRNSIIMGDLVTSCKDWMVFPEGRMVKAKDISKLGNHYCVKIDGACQRVHTGSAFFALTSQLLREDYFNHKIKNFKKFQRKYFIKECTDINKNETMIVPINISYSNLRTGKNFLMDMASKFLQDIGKHFLEELEIEGNIVLNSKITIQILKPISTRKVIEDIYEHEKDHTKIVNKYRYELTHMFMTKIYKSLTINFDHIFALTLFLSPKKRMEKNQLKRIIYLVAKQIKINCLTYDNDLEKDIIKLISYEKFAPFEDILNVAIQSGIIQEENTYYVIDKNALLNSYTHHTIRLKNILRVILNEVLIIDKMHEFVKQYLRMTTKQLNDTLLEQLQTDEIYEYESDYAAFEKDEDIKPREIGTPYILHNDNSQTCIINLHGFSSAPKEVEQISLFLHQKGFNVYAPRLKGHGTSPKDLKQTQWQDWYLSLCRAITIATLKYNKVYLMGFSTGGLLALLSTKKCYIEFAGIICINAALHLNDIRMKTVLPAVSFWNDLVKAFNAQDYAKEYVPNHAENPDINYNKHYVQSIEQLNALMKKTQKKPAQY